jgi:hypothetical protein
MEGAGWLLLAQLSYTSSAVNTLAVALCAAVCLVLPTAAPRSRPAEGFRARLRRPFLLLFVLLVASSLSFAFYYRFFVPDLGPLLGRLGRAVQSGADVASVYPREGVHVLLYQRSMDFFGVPFLFLAALGLAAASAARRATLVRAWVLAYLLLIALRARIPDVFRYGHETTFVTPLVALLGGAAIARARANAEPPRATKTALRALVAGALVGAIIWSARRHSGFLRDQLGNAL